MTTTRLFSLKALIMCCATRSAFISIGYFPLFNKSVATNPGREVYIKMLHPGKLCQRFDIGILEAFGGRVGRCNAQSFSACNGTDDSNMSGAFFLEIVEGGSHHAGKSLYIGTCRVQFDVRL